MKKLIEWLFSEREKSPVKQPSKKKNGNFIEPILKEEDNFPFHIELYGKKLYESDKKPFSENTDNVIKTQTIKPDEILPTVYNQGTTSTPPSPPTSITPEKKEGEEKITRFIEDTKFKLKTLPTEHEKLLINVLTFHFSESKDKSKLADDTKDLVESGNFHLLPELIYYTRNLSLENNLGETCNGKLVRKIIENDLSHLWHWFLENKKAYLFPKNNALALREKTAKEERVTKISTSHTCFELLVGIYYGCLTKHYKNLCQSLEIIKTKLSSEPISLPDDNDVAVVSYRISNQKFRWSLWGIIQTLKLYNKQKIKRTELKDKHSSEIDEVLSMIEQEIKTSNNELKKALFYGCHFQTSIPMCEALDLIYNFQNNLSPLILSADKISLSKRWYKDKIPKILKVASVCSHRYPGPGHFTLANTYAQIAEYFENTYQPSKRCFEEKILQSPVNKDYINHMLFALYNYTIAIYLFEKQNNKMNFLYFIGNSNLMPSPENIKLNLENTSKILKNRGVTDDKIDTIVTKAEEEAQRISKEFEGLRIF